MARQIAMRTPLADKYPALYGPDGRQVPSSLRADGDRADAAGPTPRVRSRRQSARAYVPSQTHNLQTTIRGESTTEETFASLRELAKVDMVQAAIYVIVGQVTGMDWEARLLPEFDGDAEQYQDEVAVARAFLSHPDPLRGRAGRLRPWLSLAIREIVTTDALSVYPRRTRGGDPLALQILDGGTIKPLVDGLGNPRLPPDLAYVQYVRGIAETGFTVGELWYAPMHPQVDSPYGQSYVERVLWTVNTAVRFGLHDLSYFTDGVMPDSLFAPADMSDPESLEALQDDFDVSMSGRDDRRAGGMRFVPPGQYIATKVRQWTYDYPEWLMRLIGYAFQVSTAAIQKQANRSTSETQAEAQLEAGSRPVAAHLSDILTDYVQVVLGAEHVCVGPAVDDVVDATVEYQRNVAYVAAGIYDVDEVRVADGKEPREETPEAVEFQRSFLEARDSQGRGVFTVNELRRRGGEDPFAGADGEQRVSIALAGAGPPTGTPRETGGGPPSVTGLPAEPRRILFADGNILNPSPSESAELSRWLGVARRRAQRGKAPRPWTDSEVSPLIRARIEARLSKAATPSDVAAAFKAAEPFTARQRALEARLRSVVADWLQSIRERVTAAAVAELESATVKMTIPLPDASIRQLWDQLVAVLTEAVEAGGIDAAAGIGVNFVARPEAAIEFARERAAELVGRRLVDGELVPNPNPTFAITDTVRADIERQVRTAIADGWSPSQLRAAIEGHLGFERADTVARTEAAFAHSHGARSAYAELGVEHVRVLDGPGCLPTGHRDGAPRASGRLGVVELESQADGQRWTLEQYERHIIGHPNCTRVASPVEG